ncbi:unnamed protein product [Closterium sp. Naga37s-1]|nr:unnamed protein product [Closterium sp. Naga37s-1]
MPIPVIAKKREGTQELKARRKVRRGANYWIRRGLGVAERKGEGEDKPILVVESALEVLGCAADVRALAGSLTRDLNFFHGQLPAVFPEETKAAEGVADVVRTLAQRLEELADRIEASLSAEQRREVEEELEAQALQEQMDKEANVQERVLRRLGGLSNTSAILERVRQRIASVDISFGDFSIDLPTIKGAGGKAVRTLVDTWRRLNGRPPTTELEPLASGLPRPDSTGDKEEEKKLKLLLEGEALDRRLNEAIRNREQRLRQRNVLVRARLAREIKALDDEVNELRKELAVRTLQLQMQVIYMFLEQELLFAADSQDVRSDEDESLLVAEYGLLDADLARLRTAVDRNEAILIEDEELEALAIDIPDLKFRLGIMEEPSVPLQQRAQMTVEEAKGKVGEGASFFARGVRLLAGDVAYSARLFWVAATGTTLKAREVQTLRRTATDLLVVIPFAIILIAPITPVGHVAVFGFLQRYFPGFFPSAFSSRRQEVMVRYENLKLQMATASGSEKEKVQAMAAAAATETFEASEEDSAGGGGMGMHGGVGGGSGGGGMGMGMGGFAFGLGFGRGENVGGQSSRIWRDERAKLLLLQEKLPGISRLVSSLREADGRRDGEAGEKAEGGLASSLQALASPLLSSSGKLRYFLFLSMASTVFAKEATPAAVESIQASFPGSVEETTYVASVADKLKEHGFSKDNSIALVSTCRDEASRLLDSTIDKHFGLTFALNGLAGVPPGGALAIKAGASHSPQDESGKERYVFFGLTHIGVDETGAIGKMRREGRSAASGACGALLALTAQFSASKDLPEASEDDLEVHNLTKKLLAVNPEPNIVAVTKAAVDVINSTLEHLISVAVDSTKADYAVITGVQIHSGNNPVGTEFKLENTVEYITPSLAYVVVDGVKKELSL